MVRFYATDCKLILPQEDILIVYYNLYLLNHKMVLQVLFDVKEGGKVDEFDPKKVSLILVSYNSCYLDCKMVLLTINMQHYFAGSSSDRKIIKPKLFYSIFSYFEYM